MSTTASFSLSYETKVCRSGEEKANTIEGDAH
jgi:hypothetical protein